MRDEKHRWEEAQGGVEETSVEDRKGKSQKKKTQAREMLGRLHNMALAHRKVGSIKPLVRSYVAR